jgi:membrane protease YdiL (CAAX protease family)
MKERFQRLSPFIQLIVLILIGAVAFLVISIISSIVITTIYPELPLNDITVQQEYFPVQFMMMYYFPFQAGFLLVPGLVFMRWSSKITSIKNSTIKGAVWAVLLFACVFLLLPFFSEINRWITEALGMLESLESQKVLSDSQMKNLLGSTDQTSFFVGILIIGILTGIAEEIAFRRLLFAHMLSFTHQLWLSIVGSAFIFAILHFNYLQFIPLMTFGIALAMIYYYSGSIWIGAGLHALNNIINLWWLSTDNFPTWMEQVDVKTIIPSTLLLTGLLYYKFFRERTTR